MVWEDTHWLLLLWLLPLLGGVMAYAWRRRQAAARRFATADMFDRLRPATALWTSWCRAGLTLAGLGLLVLAAARPQWGESWQEVRGRGVDLFVLLDVSRSMLASDVRPSRLERAKSDVRDLLPRLAGDRVGLIAFAGAPAVVAPLTIDHAYLRQVLAELDVDSAPRGGSLIGDAIRKGLESLEPRPDRDQSLSEKGSDPLRRLQFSGRSEPPPKGQTLFRTADQVLVLLTDGDDQESFPLEAAELAARRQVKLIVVGLGDLDEGSRIPVRNADGSSGYLQSAGREVWTKLNEGLLKELALATGGAYIPARTRDYDLGRIYDEHLAHLKRGELASERRRRLLDRFQWFAAAGLGMLVWETCLFGRPRARFSGETTT